MQFEKPSTARIRRYVNVFAPKELFQYVGAFVYAISFVVLIAPHLNNPTGKIVMSVLAAFFVAGALLLPTSLIERWEYLSTWWRGTIFALFTYVLTVTLGWLPEIRSASAWKELLLLSGGAPFSSAHTLALFGMLPAWFSQDYYPHYARPGHQEQFIRGTPEVIDWELAIVLLEELGNRYGWETEPQEAAKTEPPVAASSPDTQALPSAETVK